MVVIIDNYMGNVLRNARTFLLIVVLVVVSGATFIGGGKIEIKRFKTSSPVPFGIVVLHVKEWWRGVSIPHAIIEMKGAEKLKTFTDLSGELVIRLIPQKYQFSASYMFLKELSTNKIMLQRGDSLVVDFYLPDDGPSHD